MQTVREPACVGALIRDERNRIYLQRRTGDRRLLPGMWDVVGGHLEGGETPEEALARELQEETGWKLRHIETIVADWEWEHDGVVRRELDYLVEVDGNLDAPTLEETKHDAYAWVGHRDLDLMMERMADGNPRLWDIVAKAARIRLTERLRLEPIGAQHADDLRRLRAADAFTALGSPGRPAEQDCGTAAWYGQAWDADGVGEWMAYDRDTGDLVGRGGVSRIDLDGKSQLTISCEVLRDSRCRGYATEITRASLLFAFRDVGADEVIAYIGTRDRRSRALAERFGMQSACKIVHDRGSFDLYTLSAQAFGLAEQLTRRAALSP